MPSILHPKLRTLLPFIHGVNSKIKWCKICKIKPELHYGRSEYIFNDQSLPIEIKIDIELYTRNCIVNSDIFIFVIICPTCRKNQFSIIHDLDSIHFKHDNVFIPLTKMFKSLIENWNAQPKPAVPEIDNLSLIPSNSRELKIKL